MPPSLKLFDWRETHQNYSLDFVRIFLGAALFIRGYLFMADQSLLQDFIAQRGMLVGAIVIHFVTLSHLYGGFLMCLGLMTRLSALIQIPVLLGAVYLHFQEGLLTQGQSLELSILVLFLLIVLYVAGPGRFSIDYYFFKWEPRKAPERNPDLVATEREARASVIDETRTRAEREHAVPHRAETGTSVLTREPEIIPGMVAPLGTDPKLVVKYAGIFLFAFLLMASLVVMDVAPIFERGFSFEELAVIIGAVVCILGLFLFIYHSAFANRE